MAPDALSAVRGRIVTIDAAPLRMKPQGGFDAIHPPESDAAQPPLADVLLPLTRDALTAVDDPTFFATLAVEPNLPTHLAPNLTKAYGV